MRLTPCRLRCWRVPLLALTLATPATLPAQADHPDAGLTRALGALTRDFRGDVGIYVRHLRTGRTAALRADERFPTASTIKVPIMATIFERIANGQLGYLDTAPPPRPVARDPGGDLVAGLSDTAKVEVGRLLTLSLTFSDNTASLWLQQLAGGGAGINRWLEGHGFDSTRVNARTAGREAAYEEYGWGETTPREMARLVTLIRQGRVVSPAASEEMYRTMTRSYWTGEALSQIPPTVQAASKQGEVDRSRSEVVLVNAPSGDYVFCVITRNQEDESRGAENEGYVLLRRVSALLWRHFEPTHPWAPADGVERFKAH
jgi:beta-lactamase class A